MSHCCKEMDTHANSDIGIVYLEKFREYGISYNDGGSSFQEITFCPWCGKRLPSSLRDEWFELIESLGLEPDDELPDEIKSDLWWKKRVKKGDRK